MPVDQDPTKVTNDVILQGPHSIGYRNNLTESVLMIPEYRLASPQSSRRLSFFSVLIASSKWGQCILSELFLKNFYRVLFSQKIRTPLKSSNSISYVCSTLTIIEAIPPMCKAYFFCGTTDVRRGPTTFEKAKTECHEVIHQKKKQVQWKLQIRDSEIREKVPYSEVQKLSS